MQILPVKFMGINKNLYNYIFKLVNRRLLFFKKFVTIFVFNKPLFRMFVSGVY